MSKNCSHCGQVSAPRIRFWRYLSRVIHPAGTKQHDAARWCNDCQREVAMDIRASLRKTYGLNHT